MRCDHNNVTLYKTGVSGFTYAVLVGHTEVQLAHTRLVLIVGSVVLKVPSTHSETGRQSRSVVFVGPAFSYVTPSSHVEILRQLRSEQNDGVVAAVSPAHGGSWTHSSGSLAAYW